MTSRSALIVGGGIAGLSTAVALCKRGWAVELVEVRDNWSVQGWGLSLMGPALRAFEPLGLTDTLIAAGYPIYDMTPRTIDGTEIARFPFARLLGDDRPAQVGLMRPVLADILFNAASEAGAVLRSGLTVTAVDGRIATLSDGSTRDVDLVVGADGVASAMRTLIGRTEEPVYSGQMIWRAIVDRPEWCETGVSTFAGGRDNSGIIPITPTKAYCFVTENTDEPKRVADEDLADAMRAIMAPFGGIVAEVRDGILDPANVVRRPAHNILLEAPWHSGRVVLLGDAAHSPSPQLTSGATLAVEDAVVLAEELDRTDDIETALTAYVTRRMPRARLVVEGSIEIKDLERTGRQPEVAALIGKAHGMLAAPI